MSALLSYRNFIDAAASILTLPFDSAAASHPISNLKLRGLGQFLELTGSPGDMTIDIDFGSSRTFNVIGCMGLGMETPEGAGSIVLSYATSPDGVSYGSATTVTMSDQAAVFLPGSIIAAIDAGVSTRYLRVEVIWSYSSPKRLARLWIDNALIIESKVEASASFGFDDAGQLDKTDGQQYVEFQRPRTKRLEMTMRALSTMEAWGFDDSDDQALNVVSVNGLQFVAGTTGEVIVLPKVTATVARELWIRRTGVYGHIDRSFTIEQDGNSTSWTARVQVTEER